MEAIIAYNQQSRTSNKIKHICNSHIPEHRPKISKELALPTQPELVKKNSPTLQKIKCIYTGQ
jgi:hypothetical protein